MSLSELDKALDSLEEQQDRRMRHFRQHLVPERYEHDTCEFCEKLLAERRKFARSNMDASADPELLRRYGVE